MSSADYEGDSPIPDQVVICVLVLTEEQLVGME